MPSFSWEETDKGVTYYLLGAPLAGPLSLALAVFPRRGDTKGLQLHLIYYTACDTMSAQSLEVAAAAVVMH